MRIPSITILLFGIFLSVISQQQVTLSYSKAGFDDFSSLYASVLDDNDNLQVLKQVKRKAFVIETYNAVNMKLIWTHEINVNRSDEAGTTSGAFTPLNLIRLGSHTYLIMTAREKSGTLQHVALQQIDEMGKPKGRMIQLGSFKLKEDLFSVPLTTVTSENREYLAVAATYTYENEVPLKLNIIRFKIADKSLEFYELNTGLSSRWSDTGKLKLTNNGNIIIPVSEERNNSVRPSKLSEKKLKLFISKTGTNTFSSINVLPEDYVYSTIDYRLAPDQTIECWGMYSEIEDKYSGGDAMGLFNLLIDPSSGEVINESKAPFSIEMIAKINAKKPSRVKPDEGISNRFNLSDIVFRNGERWLVFEDVTFHISNTYTASTATYLDYQHYNFSAVLLIKADMNCNVETYVQLPKKQITIDDKGMYSSVLVKEENGMIILFYNDMVRNTSNVAIPMKKVNPMSDLIKAGLLMIEMNDDGSWTKTLVKENAGDEHLILPNSNVADKGNTHFGIYTTSVYNEKDAGISIGFYKLEY